MAAMPISRILAGETAEPPSSALRALLRRLLGDQ